MQQALLKRKKKENDITW